MQSEKKVVLAAKIWTFPLLLRVFPFTTETLDSTTTKRRRRSQWMDVSRWRAYRGMGFSQVKTS